jgi:hypothetical protein
MKVGKKIMSWGFDNETEEYAWDDFCENLTCYLEKKNPHGGWHAEVKNFGWQSRNGHKDFNATTGKQFLRAALPNCECHYNIHNYGKGIAIQNYHHDSPVGNEWYYITPKKGA